MSSTKKHIVLIIDDDRDFLEVMAMAVEAKGFHAKIAETSTEALSLLIKNHNIDAVLSDVNMPEVSGMELLKTIRTRGYATPFFLLTNEYDFDEGEARKAGAQRVFKKTTSFEEIVSALKRSVDEVSDNHDYKATS